MKRSDIHKAGQMRRRPSHSLCGFTLAELLIALAILGVIATFTIPKILQSSEDEKYKAIAKEAAAMVVGAYQSYKVNNQASANTRITDLTAYMNYVATDTTSLMDNIGNGAGPNTQCAWSYCLKLHNGALLYDHNYNFNGTSNTDALIVDLDPDGKLSTVKSVRFYLYFNSKLRTYGTIDNNTYVGGTGPFSPTPGQDPTWFSWN